MVDLPFTNSHSTPGARFYGTFATGAAITITWTNRRVDSPCGAYGYAIGWLLSDGSFSESRQALGTTAGSFTVTPATNCTYIDLNVYTDTFCSDGELFGAAVSGASVAYCQYGTSTKPSVTSGIIITTGVIDAALTLIGLNPAWAIMFDTFVGKVVFGGDLCNGLPPTFPTFVDQDFIGGVPNVVDPVSRDRWWTALLASIWYQFCQCNPGPPGGFDPLPPPYPAPTLPPAAPAGPATLVCDEGDLCTVLRALNRQLVNLTAQVGYLRTDVTLIQRQAVPFAYLNGVSHGPMSGDGMFAVQGILGLSVAFSVVPPGLSSDMAPVPSWYRLGALSLGSAEGWTRRQVLTHNPHLVLDVPADVTLVGWLFEAGVTGTITELVREP